MAVTVGGYGPVLVLKGEHKDKIGYYDDEDDEPGYAIVYLGEPFVSDYAVIAHADVGKVDAKSIHPSGEVEARLSVAGEAAVYLRWTQLE